MPKYLHMSDVDANRSKRLILDQSCLCTDPRDVHYGSVPDLSRYYGEESSPPSFYNQALNQ